MWLVYFYTVDSQTFDLFEFLYLLDVSKENQHNP